MSTALLEIRDLSGGYEPVQIFSGVNLTLNPGQSVGFFGPNGHGKSTLMKTISGVLEPWTGDVTFCGERLNKRADRGSRRWRNFNYDVIARRRMDPKRVARAGLIQVPEGNLLFPEMTVEETLAIAPTPAVARSNGADLEQIQQLFPQLRKRLNSKIRYLSGGERQMVAIAAGLMGAPKLMILDEPTLGLSPRLRIELCEAISWIKDSGVPLIVIDQDVKFLSELIDTLYLFDHGRISRTIDKANIPDHEQLMAMLFGRDDV